MIHHTASESDIQSSSVEKNHAARGYAESNYGSHIAYHFLVGKDGSVKQNRSLSERTGHTRNQEVNLSSLAVVVAGNFEHEQPSAKQLDALKSLVAKLDKMYAFEQIIPHKEASPTACPGTHLVESLKGTWREPEQGTVYNVSRYYSPVPDQQSYYHESYLKDVEINCGLNKDGTAGDCFHTANGFDVRNAEPFTVVACPPNIPLGTKLHIEGIGDVTCHDRGGAIKGMRIDLWAGIGQAGLDNIRNVKNGGARKVIFK